MTITLKQARKILTDLGYDVLATKRWAARALPLRAQRPSQAL